MITLGLGGNYTWIFLGNMVWVGATHVVWEYIDWFLLTFIGFYEISHGYSEIHGLC